MWFTTLRGKLAALVTLILVLCVGGTYFYIIEAQSNQFVETTKDQAAVLTHAIVKTIQHDLSGSCAQDVQGIFERIGILPDIESLRIFDENGKVTRSANREEVGLTIEDIGLEIFKAGVPSMPYRGGHEPASVAPSSPDLHLDPFEQPLRDSRGGGVARRGGLRRRNVVSTTEVRSVRTPQPERYPLVTRQPAHRRARGVPRGRLRAGSRRPFYTTPPGRRCTRGSGCSPPNARSSRC